MRYVLYPLECLLIIAGPIMGEVHVSNMLQFYFVSLGVFATLVSFMLSLGFLLAARNNVAEKISDEQRVRSLSTVGVSVRMIESLAMASLGWYWCAASLAVVSLSLALNREIVKDSINKTSPAKP